MFAILIDKTKKTPLYEQLYQHIKQEIQKGQLKPNDKLPSKRKLAASLQISQTTIETAYEQLVSEGYIAPIPKKGFYVCDFNNDFNYFKAIGLKDYQKNSKSSSLKTFHYDFKMNAIDSSYFPYLVWRKLIKNAISVDHSQLLHGGDHQGDLTLRQSICKYLHQSRGVNCSPKQIIIGAGVQNLMQLLVLMLGKNHTYAVENPGYNKIFSILKNNHINAKPVALDHKGLSIEALYRTHANIVYITPSHQFPTGVIMPIQRRTELLNWAEKNDYRYIIEDDYDSEFRFSGRPIPSLQGLDKHNKVIYIGTFSQAIAPAIRVGYMVVPPQLLKIYLQDFASYSCPVSRIDQYALHQFIDNGHFERHLNKMRTLYRDRHDAIIHAIKKYNTHDTIKIIGANSGLHLVLSVNNGMTEQQLVDSANDYDVQVYKLSNFYYQCQNLQITPSVILGYAHIEKDKIHDGVQRLFKAWLRSYNHKH